MVSKTFGVLLWLSMAVACLGQPTEELSRSRLIWDRVNHSMMVDRDMVLAEARMDTMIEWARADKDMEQLAYAIQAKSQMHFYRAEYDTCLQLTKVAQKYFEGFRPDQALMSNNVMAHVHRQQGNMDSVFHYLAISKKGMVALGDSTVYVMTYNDLGMSFYYTGILDSAAYYHSRQLEFLSPKDSIRLFGTYINLLKIYQKLNDFDNSLDFADKAIAITQGGRFPSSHARAKSAKADLLMVMGENEAAEIEALEAVEIHEAKGFSRNASSRYATLAQAFLRNKKFEQASSTLRKIPNPQAEKNMEFKAQYYLIALELAIEKPDLEESKHLLGLCEGIIDSLGQKERINAFQYLKAQYFSAIGAHESAYVELLKHLKGKDSIISIKNQTLAANLRTKYQTAQKEEQIAKQRLELNKARSRNTQILISLGAFLLLGSLFYWFSKRQSQIKSALQASEINALKRENKLIAMQSLLSGQEEERRRIAQDLHDNIGSLMTSLKMKVLGIQQRREQTELNNLVVEVDSIINQATTEVRRISHNMTPVAMELTGLSGAVEDLEYQLTSQGIHADFDVEGLDSVVDKGKAVIIYRIIQELIQNVVKHAQATTCSLKSRILGQRLIVELSDNGKGLPQEEWDNANGMGLKSIRSRVDYLEGEIQLDNTQGTQYHISLPL